MSSVSDIEKNLRDAEHQLDIYTDNERITMQQLSELRQRLNQVNDKENQEMERIRHPFEQEEAKFETARKEYDRAHEKFVQAETEFRKFQEKFSRLEVEHNTNRNKARQSTDMLVKKYQSERAKIESEIEKKEREQREMAARRTNASHDVAIIRTRYDNARRNEIEQLRNPANNNSAPDNRRYGTYR